MKTTIRIFAFFLAIVLLSALSTPLYAEGSGSSSSTVTATVIASNSPVYSVAITSTLSAENLQRTAQNCNHDIPFTIEVSEILTLNDRQICVIVSGSDGEFVLQNGDGTSTLPYQVFAKANEDESINSGEIFATFTEIGKREGFVRIDQKNIKEADTYTGNLHFTFTLIEVE